MQSVASPLDGIVLHLTKVGDSHRLVEVLTLQLGRISLMARGARASKKRFGGVLEVFSSLRLHVQPGRAKGFATLQAADMVNARLGIRQSFEAIGRASALCACVRRLVPEEQAAPDVHALLSGGLDALDAGGLGEAAAVYPRLAALSGILPDLQRCGHCGRETSALGVSQAEGVLLCRLCGPRSTPLSQATLWSLRGSPIPDDATATTVEGTVMAWVAAHTGRPWRGLTPFITLP